MLRRLSYGSSNGSKPPLRLHNFHQNFNNVFKDSLRHFSRSRPFFHGEKGTGPLVSVTFIDKDGTRITVKEPAGTNILEVAHANKIDLEGACEGSLACSTCHVIVQDPKLFKILPPPKEEEEDMLDLAFGLTDTSRLGCQIILSPELEGMELQLPAATRNMYHDGTKPKPH